MLIGQAHSQFLGGFTVTRKMQSTDWSGLGHVTTLGIGMQIHSSKPHGLRVGFPQGKIKVQFLEEGMLHRIKYIYIYVYLCKHLECRDMESESCPKKVLEARESIKKKNFYSVGKNKKRVMRNGTVNRGQTL